MKKEAHLHLFALSSRRTITYTAARHRQMDGARVVSLIGNKDDLAMRQGLANSPRNTCCCVGASA